jgi:hypothetical protein
LAYEPICQAVFGVGETMKTDDPLGNNGVNWQIAPTSDMGSWGYAMATQMTLGDAVRQLALRMSDQNVKMPFKNEEPWHVLFFRLKHEARGAGRPQFLDRLRFDSDSYPRCRELTEFLHGLHTTCNVCVPNPSYEEIALAPEITAAWQAAAGQLSAEQDEFFRQGLEIAKEEFPPARVDAA